MSDVWLLLRKDVLVLRRSPLLLGILLAYPLAIAVLVGLVASYGSSKPRVALVDEDHLPPVVRVGGHLFRIADAIDEVGKNVHLVRMSPGDADRALRSGRVIGIFEQRHGVGRLAEAAEHVVARGGDVDLPVRGREYARRDAGRMVVTGLFRNFAGHQPA